MDGDEELSKLQEAVAALGLGSLAGDWAGQVADKQFLEQVPPPAEYLAREEATPRRELALLYAAFKAAKKWRRAAGEGASWKRLCGLVPVRALCALLNYCALRAAARWKKYDERAAGVVAARLYLALVCIPGSEAYYIYHPRLLINCVRCFVLPLNMLEQEEFYVESADIDELNAQLERLLNDLLELIDVFDISTKDDDSLEETISTMVEYVSYTRVDRRSDLNRTMLSKLEGKAVQCIDKLISVDDEKPDDQTIILVFKALLPKFTAIHGNKKNLAQWRNAGISYINSLVNKYQSSTSAGLSCFIQHLSCGRDGLERIETRSIRVKIVMQLLALIPLQPYLDLLKWFIKLSRNNKPILRLFALEVLGCLITGSDRSIDEVNDNNEQEDATFLQANDTTLVENIDSEDLLISDQSPHLSQDHQKVAHKDLLLVIYDRCQDTSSSVRTKAVSLLAICTKSGDNPLKSVIQEIFQDELVLLEIATSRMNDEKVSVRKAAISLVQNIFCCNPQLLTKENLEALVLHCRDGSLMVRCAAISSLTFLIMNCSSQVVVDAWLTGPLHQLSDPEVKVQDLVLENLKNILFTPLTKYQSPSSHDSKLPWMLLNGIIKKNLRRHLSRACMNLAKSSKIIDKNLVNILKTHISTENNLKAWVLLTCIARHIEITDVEFVIKYFNEINQNQRGDIRLLTLVLEVLCEWFSSVPLECRSELNAILVKGLQNGSFPAGATRAVVNLALRLSSTTTWIDDLILKCENNIFSSVDSETGINGFSLLVMADLYLVSDLKPSSKLVDTLCKIITSVDEEVSAEIKAQAIVALGKISLREKPIAGISAPLCADVLSSGSYPLSMKINSMCVLADLCVRFTSIVEPLMPGVCMCLGSTNITLRKSAVNLVTQLLVGDFLRLKGSLYFHYFSLICDKNEDVRDVANYYILQCLAQRNKNIIYHNFVEGLFYYNSFKGHETYGKTDATEEEKELFALHGEGKRSTRHTIYEVMIMQMSDVQRMNVQIKICSVVETALKSDINGSEILRDIMVTLRKAAKPPQAKQNSDDIAIRVTTNIVSQKMKMNMVDVVVPTIMKLYRELCTTNSPLIPDIVAYACDLLKEYKEEIEQADVELLEEMKALQNMHTPNTPHRSNERRVVNIPDFIDDDDDMSESSNLLQEFENTAVSSTPIVPKIKKLSRLSSIKKSTSNIKAKKTLKMKTGRSFTK